MCYGVVFGNKLSEEEKAMMKEKIQKESRRFIAQEVIDFMDMEVVDHEDKVMRKADLRVFVLSEEETKVNEPKEEEAEGYEECTIAGYSGIMKQTVFYGYVSSYLRLKINEGTNYDAYATTYVDDSVLTDTVELAAATNTMKNDPDTYYQKSLELLEAMQTVAEFREPVDSWFE